MFDKSADKQKKLQVYIKKQENRRAQALST